jgi:hypothetical protein
MKSIRAIKYIVIVVVLLTAFGCGSGSNGSMTLTKTMEDIHYQIDYLPDYSKDNLIQMADLDYYRFTISEEKGIGKIRELFKPSGYNKLLFYINKNIENDFKGVYGESELSPVQVYFESNNKLANKIVFLLAFEKNQKADETTIVFNDNIFNNGILNFKYKTAELKTL